VQVRFEPISFSELKIKYENRLKPQNLRIGTPILIDPLSGVETTCSVEMLSLPLPEPKILAETSENTLDFSQKTPSRIESNLQESETEAPHKPPPVDLPLQKHECLRMPCVIRRVCAVIKIFFNSS